MAKKVSIDQLSGENASKAQQYRDEFGNGLVIAKDVRTGAGDSFGPYLYYVGTRDGERVWQYIGTPDDGFSVDSGSSSAGYPSVLTEEDIEELEKFEGEKLSETVSSILDAGFDVEYFEDSGVYKVEEDGSTFGPSGSWAFQVTDGKMNLFYLNGKGWSALENEDEDFFVSSAFGTDVVGGDSLQYGAVETVRLDQDVVGNIGNLYGNGGWLNLRTEAAGRPTNNKEASISLPSVSRTEVEVSSLGNISGRSVLSIIANSPPESWEDYNSTSNRLKYEYEDDGWLSSVVVEVHNVTQHVARDFRDSIHYGLNEVKTNSGNQGYFMYDGEKVITEDESLLEDGNFDDVEVVEDPEEIERLLTLTAEHELNDKVVVLGDTDESVFSTFRVDETLPEPSSDGYIAKIGGPSDQYGLDRHFVNDDQSYDTIQGYELYEVDDGSDREYVVLNDNGEIVVEGEEAEQVAEEIENEGKSRAEALSEVV